MKVIIDLGKIIYTDDQMINIYIQHQSFLLDNVAPVGMTLMITISDIMLRGPCGEHEVLGLEPDTLEPDCIFSSSKVLLIMRIVVTVMMMVVKNRMSRY